MPNTQTLETTSASQEQAQHEHDASESRRAAAVTAAYILEAVRK
ncbi:MAG TPA: hypothetical protein VKA88_06820 [Solirubrobacterales bacterium]|nr:hypothetical protein [Solirubrobacterales bacterium]